MRLIFLDLDDTLLNTELLKKLTPLFIKDCFGVEIEDFQGEYQLFKEENNNIYSIAKHIRHYAPGITFAALRQKFCQYFSQYELLFDYTEVILQDLQSREDILPIILTFGEDEAQILKISLYECLLGLDLKIVQVSKRDVFEESLIHNSDGTKSFVGVEGNFSKIYLFDDNVPEGLESSENVHIISIEKGGLRDAIHEIEQSEINLDIA